MVEGCVGLSALYFCLFFFVYFPMLFLPTPKKKKHRSARIANGERLRRRHQAKMVPDNHPSSFCFLVFSVPPPFLSSNIPQAFLITFSFFLCQDLLLCLLGGGFLAGCAGCRSSGSLHSLLTGSLWPALRCTASCCNRFGRLAQWCKRDLWCRGD